MKFLFFIFTFFYVNFSLSQSNDSPNLDYESKQELSWNEWINNIKKDLKNDGFKNSTIYLLDDLSFNPRVVELDRKQPEFKLTFKKYLDRNINDHRIKELNQKITENSILLKEIYEKFGVDPKIIASLWAIETSFGKYLGKFDILRSLSSLAYDGRRKDFFLKELRIALKILDQGHINRKQFKGSWAGAFGQTQFMPSTFEKYAINFDKNEKINLFSKADALASGANYLMNAGWNKSLTWGEKVKLNLDDNFKKLSKDKKFKKQIFWENNGIILKNKYNESDRLRLIIPDLNDDQCFLVTKNFDVILNWNRSNYFALTVFLLSNEINK